MPSERFRLDLTILGSGNAFGAEGRAFSGFLLNGRYLFDCGPTLLPQLRRAGVETEAIDAVFISHFHGDHFFGLPFLFLDARHHNRTRDLVIVGPPGIEERTESLDDLAFTKVPHWSEFRRVYREVEDGAELEVEGLRLRAAAVEHVSSLRCFAYKVTVGERSLVYSGDSKLCDGLVGLVKDADALVLECACDGNAVHLSPQGIADLIARARPDALTVLTHLDGGHDPLIEALARERNVHLASDLSRFVVG